MTMPQRWPSKPPEIHTWSPIWLFTESSRTARPWQSQAQLKSTVLTSVLSRAASNVKIDALSTLSRLKQQLRMRVREQVGHPCALEFVQVGSVVGHSR